MPISMYFPSGHQYKLAPQPTIPPQLPHEELDTDFKREYPPDVFGREADDTSRVWKVHRKYATAHDDTLLDGWNATLDILLIFAGLFSAVVTAFVIESYQALQFDNDSYIVNALYALVAANSAAAVLVDLPKPPTFTASPSGTTLTVNRLWFVSLFLALAVSLLSILIKQWLREYKARNNAPIRSPRHWSHCRTYLFQALMDWPVAGLISVLPVLLHLALFIFLAGMVAFLWDLDETIGLWITILTSLISAFYIISIVIPYWRPEFPTSTPAVNVVRYVFTSAALAALRARFSVARWAVRRACNLYVRSERLRRSPPFTCITEGPRRGIAAVRRSLVGAPQPDSPSPMSREEEEEESRGLPIAGTIRGIAHIFYWLGDLIFAGVEIEDRLEDVCPAYSGGLTRQYSDGALIWHHIQQHEVELNAAVLQWLVTTVSDSDAVAVAVQTLGSLPRASVALLQSNTDIREAISLDSAITRTAGEPGPTEIARIVKSWYSITCFPPNYLRARDILAQSTYPDFVVLFLSLALRNKEIHPYRRWESSPTLTTTVMTVIDTSTDPHALSLLQHTRLDDKALDWDCVTRFLTGLSQPSSGWDSQSVNPSAGKAPSHPMVYTLEHALRWTLELRGAASVTILRLAVERYPELRIDEPLLQRTLASARMSARLLEFLFLSLYAKESPRRDSPLVLPGPLTSSTRLITDILDFLSSHWFLNQSVQDSLGPCILRFVDSAIQLAGRVNPENYSAPYIFAVVARALHAGVSTLRMGLGAAEGICVALSRRLQQLGPHDRRYILNAVLDQGADGRMSSIWHMISNSKSPHIDLAVRVAVILSEELLCWSPPVDDYEGKSLKAAFTADFLEHLNFVDLLHLASSGYDEDISAVSRNYRALAFSSWRRDMAQAQADNDVHFRTYVKNILDSKHPLLETDAWSVVKSTAQNLPTFETGFESLLDMAFESE